MVPSRGKTFQGRQGSEEENVCILPEGPRTSGGTWGEGSVCSIAPISVPSAARMAWTVSSFLCFCRVEGAFFQFLFIVKERENVASSMI